MPFDPVSAGVSALQGLGQSAFNAYEADQQMRFQRNMANTSHQREVTDLRKAGLNPLLSINKGAAVPSGSSAQASSPDIAASGISGAMAKHQADLVDSQASSAKAVAANQNAQTQGTLIDNSYKTASNALNLEMLKNQVKTSNLSPQEKQKQIDALEAAIQKSKADANLSQWSAKDLQDKLKYGGARGVIEPIRSVVNSAKSFISNLAPLPPSDPRVQRLDKAVKEGRIVPRGGGK